MYLPGMKWGFGCSFLSKKQCASAQRKAKRAFLSAMGFNPNMPEKVVFGPEQFGGNGFLSFETAQGTLDTCSLLQYLAFPKEHTAQVLLTDLKWLQTECGTAHPVLEHPMKAIPPITNGMPNLIRTFLREINGSLQCSGIQHWKPLRVHDSCIIDDIINCRLFTQNQIQQLNHCRLQLQVKCLSDITTADGKHID
jgi:hypothetical protein